MKIRILLLASLVANVGIAKIAPSFSGSTMGGGRVRLAELVAPNRTLLLTFWATWCVPCIEELKQVSAKLQENPDIALDVMTVNVDTSETSTDVKPLLKANGLRFPVILDPKHEILVKYNESKTLPFSVLIGENGTIESTFNGYSETMFSTIQTALNKQKESNGDK